ncbi:MAG: energy-coupling factor ABC transporter ATP-binding protein [Clostridiales bacterium]|nr:energy-coupling factor ABC transporter ATP-binding protein [Clostridiales bacterium]
MIELKEVYYSYHGINAIRNISLEIKNGEAVTLLGPNGSGKSTLLKIINGLVFPHRGVYRFQNEDIHQKRLQDDSFSKSFHQKIGFIFQNSDSQLFCSNVFDEIAFGPRQMGMTEDEVDKRVNDCIDLLKIQEIMNRQPYHLSGGEKRKVAIASVLAMNPDVLTLDEPMNGLDPKTGKWLVEFLRCLSRAGKTIVVSTHNLDFARKISNRAILLNGSHSVAADLPTDNLLDNIELLKKVNLLD